MFKKKKKKRLDTSLPASAELTLVDPFSCTGMEGTLQGGQNKSSQSRLTTTLTSKQLNSTRTIG